MSATEGGSGSQQWASQESWTHQVPGPLLREAVGVSSELVKCVTHQEPEGPVLSEAVGVSSEPSQLGVHN